MRDSKLLHLIFGISGLAMLVTTVWMLAADHRREWKDYVRKFRDVETWMADARLAQQQTAEYEHDVKAADEELKATFRQVPDASLVNEFDDEVEKNAKERSEKVDFAPLNAAYEELRDAPEDKRPPLREKFREHVQGFITRARFREDDLASAKKFANADLDVLRSKYELGVGTELPKGQLDDLQGQVTEAIENVAKADLVVQVAKTHRQELERIYSAMVTAETDAAKKLADLEDTRRQLLIARNERRQNFMRDVVSMPILDAFGGTKVDQIWLPKLTIYNNFIDVARFDRCTNCHLGLDKTAPGSAVEPLYRPQHDVTLTMATPAEPPASLQEKAPDARTAEDYAHALNEIYGLEIAPHGLFDADDAMVSVIAPESLGAKAGFEVGDVIAEVGNAKVLGRDQIFNYLIETADWGQPLVLTVRRGVPQPYASHPRLDLFVGSLSPHKLAEVGCTICHDGQGSGTAFKWASHSPNDFAQAERWKSEYGWFDNHHWIFPMYPKRFAESLCLKCHHDVTELEPSDRFPDPPAPKLSEGFHLIQQVGCFGCHEINGFDGPKKRIGPDLRSEPNYTAAAAALIGRRWLERPAKSVGRGRFPRAFERRGPPRAGAVAEERRIAARRRDFDQAAGEPIGRCRDARRAAQSRSQPAPRGQQARSQLPLLLGAQAHRFPAVDQDAAVLRPVGPLGRRRPARR